MSLLGHDGRLDILADRLLALETHELEAVLDASPPEDVRLIQRTLASQLQVGWRATPVTMWAHFEPNIEILPYQTLLGEKFRQLHTGESRFQIWNLPARYGKSTIASQWGPAWVLDQNARAKTIITSYGDTLAAENADAVRTILETHADELSTHLRPDKRARRRFATPEGGGLLAAAMGAGITGFGAGRGGGVIIDDPFKNWEEAHSETVRERVWNHYRSVLRLRLDDESAFILIVMTRWHEDDLVGRLVAAGEDDGATFEVVRLAAVAEEADPKADDPVLRLADPLGRLPGQTLGRFPLEEVQARSREIGSYLASAMEQQRPAPEEGGEIKRAWFKWADPPEKADDWSSSWDMKLKDTETGDFVVGQVWGRIGADFYGVDQFRGQWDQATTRAAIALTCVRYPMVRRHFVENTGYGPEVIKALKAGVAGYELSDEIAGLIGCTEPERPHVQAQIRKGISGIVAVNVKGTKSVRARAVSPMIEAGNVHLPDGKAWSTALVNESAAFPNGTHDDMVDAMTQALSRMSQVRARMSSPTRPKGKAGTTPRPKAPVARNIPDPDKLSTPKAVKKKASVTRGKRRVVGPKAGGVKRRPGPGAPS